MRADAKKNRDHLLAIAGQVVQQQGAGVSLRDIARKAEVGLATLFRHFPTREALFEALLRTRLDELTAKADQLSRSTSPDQALVSWFRDGVSFVTSFRGVTDLMAAAIADPESALHVSCVTVRSAGDRLLSRAQAEGSARADIDGTDLFALMGALGWTGDQASFADRTDHLVDLVAQAILADAKAGGRDGAALVRPLQQEGMHFNAGAPSGAADRPYRSKAGRKAVSSASPVD